MRFQKVSQARWRLQGLKAIPGPQVSPGLRGYQAPRDHYNPKEPRELWATIGPWASKHPQGSLSL
jgi:hypothetical protein